MSTSLPPLSQIFKKQSSLPLPTNGKRTFLSEIALQFSEICPDLSGGLIIAVPLKELQGSVKPIFAVPNEGKWKAAYKFGWLGEALESLCWGVSVGITVCLKKQEAARHGRQVRWGGAGQIWALWVRLWLKARGYSAIVFWSGRFSILRETKHCEFLLNKVASKKTPVHQQFVFPAGNTYRQLDPWIKGGGVVSKPLDIVTWI